MVCGCCYGLSIVVVSGCYSLSDCFMVCLVVVMVSLVVAMCFFDCCYTVPESLIFFLFLRVFLTVTVCVSGFYLWHTSLGTLWNGEGGGGGILP